MFKVMDGSARGAGAALTRALLATAEPFYAAAMLLRNKSYDSGFRKVSRLDRPVISVGNVTTGGTGKTPIVRWLAEKLREEGRQVAILARGYKATPGQLADEMQMLDRSLNHDPARPVFLRAHPNRVAAGQSLLKEHPKIDLLLLDDGFQHRRLARDFDLVLISATRPFGFDHVLPRGLLREPLRGLRRADAIVLTHADQVGAGELSRVESQLRRYGPGTPIYRAVHALTGLRSSRCASSGDPDHSMDLLSNRRFFAFCGIGTPDVLDSQLRRFGKQYVGQRWFPDHHRYTPGDLVALRTQAKNAGAEIMVTTEKDWVKIAQLPESQSTPQILRIDMQVRFLDGSDARLLAQLRSISAPSRRG